MQWIGKNFIVAGTGLSGIAATNLLLFEGANVYLYDGNEQLDKEKVLGQFYDTSNITLILGQIPEEILSDISALIISPGISCEAPFLSEVKKREIPIWSEIELAWNTSDGNVVAITGTNGKTTTTALVGHIMRNYYDRTFIVGNIGIPFTRVAKETSPDSVIVAEISSFQLETIHTFLPKVSAVLNVTPDHLDRHKTMENYANTKMMIAKNQGKNEFCILNYDDPLTREMGNKINATPVYFSYTTKLEEGIYLDNDDIYVIKQGQKDKVCKVDDLQLLGKHNVENVMAAIGITYWYGVPLSSIIQSVKEFQAVEHRIEYVDTVNGVDYYNDSKGTNCDAAIKGIQAMKKPTYLIGGGYDKGASYDEWILSFDGKVKELILLGQTANKIEETARKHGFTNIHHVVTLEEAVQYCSEKASNGDAVLLSPACASWGMFKNYEERGNCFKQYVKNLKE